MSTAFLQIQAAIVQALEQALTGQGVSVFANRLRPITAGKNAVVVRIDQSVGEDVVSSGKDWRTVYIVECCARALPGQDPAQAVDSLVQQVGQALAVLNLQGLGVMHAQAAAGIRWQFDDADTALACGQFGFEVMHRTPAHSLQPWT